ncbi:class I SAM-dependent methyltransferase [Terriglobus tenax]|uniref:class I SAM-dependent methyltransferase n=1 Tax=Terriglobus tenax TaxID=1111115 RepID=UPI0021E08F73|nr:class I SAM-dependent methyltransferase [Terriglobus tenax]
MLRSFFGGSEQANGPRGTVTRHSSGWTHVLKHLKAHEGLRVLDIGSTSPGNINFLTGLGHGVYMADLAEDANRPEWMLPATENEAERFDVDRFIAEDFNFGDRTFDIVLLWDVADYLPEALLKAVIARLHEVMNPGGLVLALFHTKKEETDNALHRYHLTESEMINMQRVSNQKLLQVWTNRQVERMFESFSSYKFFLAKDNLREVVITR